MANDNIFAAKELIASLEIMLKKAKWKGRKLEDAKP